MPQHTGLHEVLAWERVSEFRRTAENSALSRRRERRPRRPVVGSARRATGWFLIDLGVRLASSRADMTRSA